jgi:hypothetical protein
LFFYSAFWNLQLYWSFERIHFVKEIFQTVSRWLPLGYALYQTIIKLSISCIKISWKWNTGFFFATSKKKMIAFWNLQLYWSFERIHFVKEIFQTVDFLKKKMIFHFAIQNQLPRYEFCLVVFTKNFENVLIINLLH